MNIEYYNNERISPNIESGLGSDCDTMAELAALLRSEIPEGRNNLTENHTNLERVAEYCEANYFQSDNKRAALEETKNYTTQSLASVAYQINTLAYNFLQLLDLQTAQLTEMESQMNHIAQTVSIHKEKVARREIGVLTANKITSRQYKIIAPANPEKPIKYVRKPIDYTILDEIGHGVRMGGTPRTRPQRGSSQGSIQSVGAMSGNSAMMVGPAPTTKPPTPPQVTRTGSKVSVTGGTLSKGSREYRTPPAVLPPQVPSHYAPNYPIGHPRRSAGSGERQGGGYSTLPMPPNQHMHTLPHHSSVMSPPQVGMVHPIPQQPQQPAPPQPQQPPPHQVVMQQQIHPQTPPPPPPPATYTVQDNHASMPQTIPKGYLTLRTPLSSTRPTLISETLSKGFPTFRTPLSSTRPPLTSAPPSPLVTNSGIDIADHAPGHALLHHTLPHMQRMSQQNIIQQHRSAGAQSPPLPPPPPPEDVHEAFGRPRTSGVMPIVPDEEDLPGWVPKNYIEKVVAIYDYYADKDDELSFQESAVIYVLKKNDDGWWEGVMDGITGLFPGNYVEPCV